MKPLKTTTMWLDPRAVLLVLIVVLFSTVASASSDQLG